MSRVLVVEDEERIGSFIRKGLRAAGYSAEVVGDGQQALAATLSGDFDLMVLDLGLPGMDGMDVLRRLRDLRCAIPVVIVTARDSVDDTVTGLDSGADDYVTKPFRFEELLARVRARLRNTPTAEPDMLRVGDATLDLRTRRVFVRGALVDLTTREFALAELFFRHPGQVLSREQVLSHVWGYSYDPGSNVVDVYVGYLRRKLGQNSITTVRGAGYRLESSSRTPPGGGRGMGSGRADL